MGLGQWSGGAGVLCLVIVTAFGCGTDDSSSVAREVRLSDADQVADVYRQWVTAVEERRYDDACALQTRALQEEMTAEAKEALELGASLDPEAKDLRPTCALLLEGSVPLELPDVEIGAIKIEDAKATAKVGYDTWRFEQESGRWRIAHLD